MLPSHRPRRTPLRRVFAVAVMLLCALAAAAAPATAHYNLPAGNAGEILKRFARQANREIVFSASSVRGIKTNAVRGELTADEAIARLLAGTGLVATVDEKTGAFAVRAEALPESPAGPPSAARGSGARRTESASDTPSLRTADDGTVLLSAFQVSTAQDQGYRASNSVSGSRFNTPIKDLPFALQAFTAEFIQDIRPNTLYDIALYSPGVTYRSSDFNNGNAELAIRGFNVAAGGLYSAQSLRDGMKGPPIMAFANVDRLEVVKGPASFLYGQVAPGGMVNLITKVPKERFEASATTTYGSYDQYSGVLDVTGPLGAGFFYRVVGSYSQDIAYWDPYDSHQTVFAPQLLFKVNDRAALSLKFERFEKRESPQLFQKPQWTYTRSGLPEWASARADPLVADPVVPAGYAPPATGGNDPNLSGVVVAGLPRNFNPMGDRDYRNSDDTAFSATLDVEAGEHWSLRTSYAHDLNVIDMEFSGRPAANPDLNAHTAAYRDTLAAGLTTAQAEAAAFPFSGFAQPRRWRWQTVRRVSDSVEGQALGRYQFGGVSLKLLLGGQYNPYSARIKNGQSPDSTNPAYNPPGPMPPWDLRDPSTWNRAVPAHLNRDFVIVSGLTGLPELTNDITHVIDRAIYAGTTWGFFDDDLLLLAGIRRTYTSLQTRDDFDTDPAVLPWAVRRTAGPEFKAARNTPQLGALYKLRPDVSLFASYSESFVPASGTLAVIDRSDPHNWTTASGGPIKPTEGKGYDIGLKTDLFGGRLSGTITYYDVKNKNIVISVPQTGPNGIFFPTFQSGLQQSQGVEIDLTLSPTDHWQLYASASFMDAKTVTVTTEADDARMLAVDTYDGFAALSEADQNLWRNVWRFKDRPLQMTAPEIYHLWTKYTFTGPLKGVFIGGGLNYIYDQTIFPETEARNHQTYTLWNGLLGYTTKLFGRPTTFTLTGKNLTNEDYLPSQNTQSRPRELIFSVTTKL